MLARIDLLLGQCLAGIDLGQTAILVVAVLRPEKLNDVLEALFRAGFDPARKIGPQVLAQIPQMTISLAVMPVYVAVIGAIGIPLFRRLGFDRVTAYYAAMPGGLQDMVLFGQEAGGDVRALSLIHATRVASSLKL